MVLKYEYTHYILCIRACRSRVRRQEGSSRFNSHYTTKIVKHPESVMVWGMTMQHCATSACL